MAPVPIGTDGIMGYGRKAFMRRGFVLGILSAGLALAQSSGDAPPATTGPEKAPPPAVAPPSISEKAEQLRAEAEECIGQLAFRTDENLTVEVEEPEGLPTDPTRPAPPPDVTVAPPPASPTL